MDGCTERRSSPAARSVLIVTAALALLYLLLPADTFIRDDRIHFLSHPDFHIAPARALDRASWAVVEPLANELDNEAEVTVVALHGLGDAPTELPFVDGLADRFPFVRWVAPQAPTRNISVRGDQPFPAWFDIATFKDLSQKEDVASLVSSARQIHLIIDEERKRMVMAGKRPRIVVAGFSQGAVMSLLVALTAKLPLEAAIILSGYLPLRQYVDNLATSAPRDTPIFWGHGADDPFLTARKAKESVRVLRAPPLSMTNVTFKTYAQLEHYWDRHELDDVGSWLEATLGWTSSASRSTWRQRVDRTRGDST